ncbi:unnamed protein product, partial [Staurois parvus]
MVQPKMIGSTYLPLSKDPTSQFKKDLVALVKKGKDNKILNKKEALYLVPDVCRLPVIYTLPKIHKDPLNPPGRPIVNGIQSVMSRMGQYIDIFLQPLVIKTKAYLRDT